MALVNTDIYNISESIEELKKQYIPESEDTLALGLYGYIGDLEAKKIQTAIVMAGELGNEVFPTRAKLDKNIITHAIMQNITDINATPAYMVVTLGILASDLDKYMDSDNKFVFDKYSPFIIGDSTEFEFHLDYDIVLTRSNSTSKATVYSAVYDMDMVNRISKIDNPYLKQPYTVIMNNNTYVFLQCILRQVAITKTYNQFVTSSIIDNKTMSFEFEDQLADFEVIVSDSGSTYNVTPIFEGSTVPSSVNYYCWYTYINSSSIRIKFERTSYMPSLNAEVEVVIKTTKGSAGNFTYSTDTFIMLESEDHGYSNVNVLIKPNTDSKYGVDKKSVDEIRKIFPKESLSRGSITTEADLTNYFNLINTETNRLIMYKKVDNQIERVYYGYFLMKNSNGDIIPTNTINLSIRDTQFNNNGDTSSYVLPAGSHLVYDPVTFVATPGEYNPANIYNYTTLYTLVVNKDPLYAAFYMCLVNEDPYLSFEYINQNSDVQFICENIHFERKLLTDKNTYKLSFNASQNINSDMGMLKLTTNPDTGVTTIDENNMRVFIVLYKEGVPYRWEEATMSGYDYTTFNYDWNIEFNTDNLFDLENNIKIENLGIAGSTERNYGYLSASTKAYVYFLAKFDNEEGRHNLDTIIPGLEGWSVSNKYEVYSGLNFFVNYSGIMNSRVKVYLTANTTDKYNFNISSVPVIGYHYINEDEDVTDFITQMNYKKMYVDDAMYILENAFQVDFKFFNTFGPSRTYTIDDTNDVGTVSIGRMDLSMRLRISLKSATDVYTKDSIIADIKEYVESLDDLNDLHFPNMVSEIREKYKSTVNYIEFLGFNGFDATTQHIYKQDNVSIDTPPEFINIRNTKDVNGNNVPDIVIEVATNSTSS